MASAPGHVGHALGYHLLGGAVEGVRSLVTEPCPCSRGASGQLQGPDGTMSTIIARQALKHGAEQREACGNYFSGYAGQISLTCTNATLQVRHTCTRMSACAAGLEVNLTLGGSGAETPINNPAASGVV